MTGELERRVLTATERRGYNSVLERRGSNWTARRLPSIQLRGNGSYDFFDADRFHAAKINRAFSQKTGTAFDLMTNDVVTAAERTGELGLGRTEDGDDRNAEECGQVHRAGVI